MTLTWIAGTAVSRSIYNWNNSSNWSSGAVPVAADTVVFPNTGTGSPYTVIFDLNQGAVQNLTIDDPNATISVEATTSDKGLLVGSNLLMNAGVLQLQAGFFQVGGINAAGLMTLNAGAVVTGNGLFSDNGGIFILNAAGNDEGTLHFNGGTVVAAVGATATLEVFANVTGVGNFQISGNSSLMFDGVVDPASVVDFTGGASATGTLIDNSLNNPGASGDPGNFSVHVTGMDVGTGTTKLDSIEIAGDAAATATFNGSVMTIHESVGARNTDTLEFGSGYAGDSVGTISIGGNTLFFLDSVCFVAGTQILAIGGERSVETLQAGDLVAVVRDGHLTFEPVKWVGYRTINLTRHPRMRYCAPIRIARGAFAEDLPLNDLAVSPDHCLLLDGKLVPAKLLVNGMTIRQDLEVGLVTYCHVELERHSILLAEGIPAESYLDTGNRAFFSNAGLALLLHPEFHVNAGLRCWATDACAPLAVSPAAVLPVWRPLADRAVALGYMPPIHATTTNADLHLVADGRRIDTIAVKAELHSFMVPAGVKSLSLVSRSVVPSVLVPYLDDTRQIGVSVRGIIVRGMAGRAEYSADHPALAQGWHAPERQGDALWRWTMGRASLPVGVVAGPVVVDVMVSGTTTYLIDKASAEICIAA